MTGMNTFDNKTFLARIRGGDFAHPGEDDAIDLVLSHVSPASGETVLDAGCGLGATADAIAKKTGADVVGVDLDAESVRYAGGRYEDRQFLQGDITKLGALGLPKVDVIYAFNSLYACADLEACFAAFREAANPRARIAVFDYIAYDATALAEADCLPRSVHSMAEMRQVPSRQGWSCTRIVNLDQDYIAWYERFLARMDENRDMLGAARSPAFFDDIRKKYDDMRACLAQGVLGGALHSYALAS